MTRFEFLIEKALGFRREQDSALEKVLRDLEGLYDGKHGLIVRAALEDPFFPLTLYRKHHLPELRLDRAGRDLCRPGR